ncbi:MAG: oligoendopeptidase F [Thermoguttaceae bacterium]|nr:oligoendopeptidase F [Thermoguttaceae bacterium]
MPILSETPFSRLFPTKDQSEKPGKTRHLLPSRADVPPADQWNLKKIFSSDAAWRREFAAWQARVPQYAGFKGKLGSIGSLEAFLRFDSEMDRASEKLLLYAYLKSAEDMANPTYQGMKGQISVALARAAQETSFARPEILAAPKTVWKERLASPKLKRWHRSLSELLRLKPHTLSGKEERVVALSAEMAQTPSKAFRLLTDADFTFGTVRDEKGTEKTLTHETFSLFLHSPNRTVRKSAFEQFYSVFDEHKNTLAALLEGSVRGDIFHAKARRYPSSLDAALFDENIPRQVYENLISGVRGALPALYRYYDIRRKKMKLSRIHFYDTYVPILSDIQFHHSWNEAVGLIGKALQPLGAEYVRTLQKGLTSGRWADRYENAGKQSGAFSYGGYDTLPYIMTNFKPDLIESVFTLAHEGGHSMHSWLSARKQSYEDYNYVIFLAEIASTFNEQLLAEYLIEHASDKRLRLWLINRQIDAVRATIFRQTMFSEFEEQIHAAAERGEALGVAPIRGMYRKLLETYFGPAFTLDEQLELECLRIPHFYRSFYVYKYATGMSAAIALARRVKRGGEAERLDYFKMLEGGCSAPPLELLRRAGVDMIQPTAVSEAMNYFDELVSRFEAEI